MTNARREDLAFIFLQFWLFGISVFAIVQDSVPHMYVSLRLHASLESHVCIPSSITALVTRILVTAWSIYAVWRTKYHANAYEEIYTRSGTPCALDVFSEYFNTRFAVQVGLFVCLIERNIAVLTPVCW